MSICLSAFLLANEDLQESEKLYTQSFSELLNTTTEQKAAVGSRSGSRDVLISDVPIDIVTSEQLAASGFMSLPEVLQKYIPGFNYPRPSITDGTDHSKPFTLRGMNPDQVLVLINGKRLHQSSLLNVNSSIGRGTSSVDLSTIPIASIQRVEVLRDGAASQYGSDAIAGVINIILKGYGLENQLSVTYGKMKAGDGATKDISLFYSIPLEYDGFFNITAEYRDKEQTNRAGADKRDQYTDGDPRNNLEDPVNLHYGNPDAKDLLLALNSEIVSDSGGIYYLHGIYNNRKSEAGAYVRRPVDTRNNTTIYPDGFLPLITPKIEDYSLSVGFKDVVANDINYDLSYTHGHNDYHFYVKNTLNHSLGDTSPTSFDSGGTSSTQNVINLDIS
ncbi:MAG: TonB-dependent receptor plug domain-containing protein, partial [Sulfurovum sp.]|nr:TonB-dependent receptor plug domain-containing protein [Sulfurovum sp.]